MTTPTTVGATAIADRATGNELKPNADGSINIGTGGGGGTQYTDGAATPANPVGSIPVFDKSGTITDVGLDNPIPAQAPAGAIVDLASLLTSFAELLLDADNLATLVTNTTGLGTQATLAAILAKLVATPALEGGNLASIATATADLVADLDTLITNTSGLGTQTTLAAVLATLTGSTLNFKNNAAGGQIGTVDFHLISAATTNATLVKASSGQVYGYEIYNSNAAVRYVKLTNLGSAPTPGTTPVARTIGVPANGRASFHSSTGLKFSTGIGFYTCTGIADADSTVVGAGDLSIDIDWA